MHNESFDLDIMMPPDVTSIDSDLSNELVVPLLNLLLDKLSALTPQPMLKNQYNMGMNYDN